MFILYDMASQERYSQRVSTPNTPHGREGGVDNQTAYPRPRFV